MIKFDISSTSYSIIKDAIKQHRLPNDFIDTVTQYYWPLCQKIKAKVDVSKRNFIGIQGTQGSGKSTCADFIKILLESEYDLKVLVASIDDFYLTKSERKVLASTVHPLLLTRGVPGTHDVNLIKNFLLSTSQTVEFKVPHFSKANDDRLPFSEWPIYHGPYDVVILEGWCVGVPPQSEDDLIDPVNQFEKIEDSDNHWRQFVNQALEADYNDVFSEMDMLVVLQAPSFNCVYEWRLLQEQKLIDVLNELDQDTSSTMNPAQIKRFISHYQRLTQHALTVLAELADVTLHLNSEHSFTHAEGFEESEKGNL